jgi:hypothetical protein
MLQKGKDIEQQTGLNSKTETHDAYKRLIALKKKKTSSGSESKGGKEVKW